MTQVFIEVYLVYFQVENRLKQYQMDLALL